MKKHLAIVTSILFFASLAIAHGNEEHIMGTVANISTTSITVQTTKHEIKEVMVTDKTTFENAGAPAKVGDLKVGDRVVIHAAKDGNKLIAHTVRFGVKK